MSKALLEVETLRLTRRTRSLRVIKEAIFDFGSEFRIMQAARKSTEFIELGLAYQYYRGTGVQFLVSSF